jgi:hypothetical protein
MVEAAVQAVVLDTFLGQEQVALQAHLVKVTLAEILHKIITEQAVAVRALLGLAR